MNAAPALPAYQNTPGLSCDAEHVYRIGSEVLLGVSEVLHENRLVDDRFFDEESRSRGTAVHAALELYANGIPRELLTTFGDLDENLWGWFKSGADFIDGLRAAGHEIAGVELRLAHDQYRYAGTVDLVTRRSAEIFVWDFKTGGAAKVTRLQLGAYGMFLMKGAYTPRKAAVELREDGSRAVLREYNALDHFYDGATFLALLTATRTRRRFGAKS